MSEYEKTLEDIKKTIGIVLDQFKAIPPEALPHEWELMKKYVFSETKIPANVPGGDWSGSCILDQVPILHPLPYSSS